VRSDAVAQVRPAESGRFLLILHNGRQLRSGRSYRQAVQALLQAR
jgi:DNA-binding LytR/AlgR family response regulator